MNVIVDRRSRHYRTVAFDAAQNAVLLIDQRLLPHHFEVIATRSVEDTAMAIREMVVRGAGAIGATAAYGLAQGARAFRGADPGRFKRHIKAVFQMLKAARPTAVDPVNAMNAVCAAMNSGETVEEQQALALAAAEEFANDDVEHCEAIGKHGAKLIRNGMNILTHCNAGWLAFVDIGTATAPMYAAQAKGRRFHVFCDETRPRSQGATLTAWELAQQGISHEIIADNAADDDQIDSPDTKAVVARRHGVPFYVAVPFSTIDWNLKSGSDIPIEERDGREVLGAWGLTARGRREFVRVANPTSQAYNPGFDVTPPELVTGIITPEGIFKPKELWANRRKLGY